jgi:23S rRNA pseudouridine955/2504/2580 synthase/23S rRNA pseudouridine1911/1915/1917 synthase
VNDRREKSKLDILAETPNWVAVVKPAGLATIPGRAETDSVLERLAAQRGLPHSGTDDPRRRVVHRLDKDTSGVLLFAKNVDTQRHFSHQFQNNTVQKEYVALVVGRPQQTEGDIDAPIARHPTDPTRMTVVKRGGRPARTLWKVEETFRGFSLLRLFPKTGKTHQIRVHLQHIGLPLAIDPLYNPPRRGQPPALLLSSLKRDYRPTRGEEERPLMARLTLHAHRLAFTDTSGERVTLEAELPKDFRVTLNQLRRLSGR